MEWDRVKERVEGTRGQAWGDLEIVIVLKSALGVSVVVVRHFPVTQGPLAKLR